MIRTAMLAAFKLEVYDRGREIDPDNSLDWYSLAVGFAIARGYTPARALSFARWARYTKGLA